MADPTTTLSWVQVVDDAIKIGLGGVVGGVFTWIVARHNNKSAIQKLLFERKAQAIHSTMLAEQLNEATRLRMQMAQKIPQTIYAQSQLMLLGEQAVVEKSQNLVKVIGSADESFKFNGSDSFDVSFFERDGKIVGQTREAFFKELQRAYHRM